MMPVRALIGVTIPDDKHLQEIKDICDENSTWHRDYSKANLSVYSKCNELSTVKLFKIFAILKDIPASLVFDTLMDSDYRKALPPRKQYIRAVSYLTAYLIRSRGPSACEVFYVSQCDPRGKLPSWAVNKATQFVAPRVVKRLIKACHNYEGWKRVNRPNFKPWLCPEQIEIPRINWSEVLSQPDIDLNVSMVVDETNAPDIVVPNKICEDGDAG
ncbi:unnamed protein product [Calicophoron daubneyi]|uniref:START domain-containing protein n=1 Tax=Calicophoron daubneyi TaxID=300641 RepID=A0AAV2TPE4_CALDB